MPVSSSQVDEGHPSAPALVGNGPQPVVAHGVGPVGTGVRAPGVRKEIQ